MTTAEIRSPLLSRRWPRITVFAVTGVLMLALALPTLLSLTIAPSMLQQAIAAQVQGKTEVPSVSLGWFSSQRISGVRIDGGDDVGSINASVDVPAGLFSLAMGGDIAVHIAADVKSATGADGEFKVLKLFEPASADVAAPAASTAADASIAVASPFFGARKIEVLIEQISLSSYNSDRSEGSTVVLTGNALLDGSEARLDLHAEASSKQGGSTRGAGSFSVKGDVHIEAGKASAIDLHRSTMDLAIAAKDVRISTGNGVIENASFDMHATKDAEGTITLDGKGAGAVEGSAASSLSMKVRAPQLIDADGRVQLDLAKLVAHIDIRALPLAPLTPFLRAAGVHEVIDPTLDVGETVDVVVTTAGAGSLLLSLDAQRVKLRFEGNVTPDGASLQEGTLDASLFVREEVVSALSGVQAQGPLVIMLSGNSIAWTKPQSASASQTQSLAGVFALELSRPLAIALPTGLIAGVDVTRVALQTCSLHASKRAGDDSLVTQTRVQLNLNEGATQSLNADASFNLATQDITIATAEFTGAIDPALLTGLTGGALKVGPRGANLKATLADLTVHHDATKQRIEAGSLRAEVGGSLIVESNGTQAAITDLAINVQLPKGANAGSAKLVALIDGASTQITQSFTALPTSVDDLAQAGLTGSVAIDGMDPSLLARIAPATKDYLGILGRGPIAFSLRNTTSNERVQADFSLKATSVESAGTLQLTRDTIAFERVRIAANLNAESLASLPIPDGVVLEPGASVVLTLPSYSMQKSANGWSASGDLAANLALKNVRVLRAPGLTAPLGVSSLEANLSYSMQKESARMDGSAMLGAGGTAGTMQFQLGWEKPVEAKFFHGAHGEISLTNFDVARFEPSFGLTAGSYSGMLGGPGSCTVRLSEQPNASAKVELNFPSTKGSFTLTVVGDAKTRVAQATGNVTAQISAEAFGKLAGIGNDPTRRVLTPVTAQCTIDSAVIPLDAALAPVLANASFGIHGSLSPLSIEISGAHGKKDTVSTGTLSFETTSKRLSEEASLRLSSDTKDKTRGAIALDVNVRGALSAKPVMDAELRASKFPAATIDVLAGTGGALQKYVGDAIDAEFVAKGFSQERGVASASVRSAFASIDAPHLAFGDGFLKIAKEKPLRATFKMHDAVKRELLATINPVFTDVETLNPAVFTVSSLAWPTDGDRRKFDAAFDLTVGEVKLTNSGPLAFLLFVAGTQDSKGMDAFVEPLRGSITHGQLKYNDFNLRMGKTSTSVWKNTLTFTGDIDLVRLYANAITTEVPLSDATHWSNQADLLVQGLGGRGKDFVNSLKVGIKLSGPLFDANGKPAKLDIAPTFPDVGKALLDNPAGMINLGKSILDAFNKK